MRHLHLLLMAFFFLFTVQVHAAKETKKASANKSAARPVKKSSSAQQTQRPSLNDTNAFLMKSSSPKANYGSSSDASSCPYKNAAMSPFSREGKMTQVQRMLPGDAYNYRTSTATN